MSMRVIVDDFCRQRCCSGGDPDSFCQPQESAEVALALQARLVLASGGAVEQVCAHKTFSGLSSGRG